MTKGTRDNLVYGGIALGSVVFLLWIIPAYTPPYVGFGIPPSTVPNAVLGIALVLSVLAITLNILAKRRSPEKGRPEDNRQVDQVDKVRLWHLARFMIPSALLIPAMEWVGFIPAGLMFMLAIQYLCGQRKPVSAILAAVGTVGIVYVAARYGLSAPMP